MSVNKVILIGNVGKDPDVRYLDNHVCVANLTLATTERGYTAQNGTQVPDRTEWHNLVFGEALLKPLRNTFTKVTSFTLRAVSVTAAMMTRTASSVTLRRYSWILWKCCHPDSRPDRMHSLRRYRHLLLHRDPETLIISRSN